MCRFLAYRGTPILLEDLIAAPAHSLIDQSQRATEARTTTNGDGFGIGWYGERDTPGLYREVHPAWSDENLRSICSQVRSRLFFAHVRASTGTATSRSNCHPFAVGRYMFMHNGQVGGWGHVRRQIEAMIPDRLYMARQGTTDSEAMLLAAVAMGLMEDPVAAMAAMLGRVRRLMDEAAIDEPLRFTAALTDGADLWAFRWASDGKPATLYWKHDNAGLIVVSEPIDGHREDWEAIPVGGCVIAPAGGPVRVASLMAA